jgi:hypothetical protein
VNPESQQTLEGHAAPVENLPWVLARFSAWLIKTVIDLLENRRCLLKERRLVIRCGSFRLKWSSLEKFARAR